MALSNLPYPRNHFFTGREDILNKLRTALTSSGTAALGQPQIISGLGGIGKTQTAIEYAYRNCNDYKAVLWTSADTELALSASFLEIAMLINLPEKDAQNPNDTAQAVKAWLENNSDWLLIVDNADNPDSIKLLLPQNPKGHVLITSRARVFDMLSVTKPIELEEMTPDEALEFLFKRTGREDNNAEERNATSQIADELGLLPLALEQAAAYITRKQCSFQNYFSGYRKRDLELLEKHGPVIGNYPKSVRTTWSLNFEQVEQTSIASADLLRLTAFLNPAKIPFEVITLGSAELGSALSSALANFDTNPLSLDEVLEPLTQFSLIRRSLELNTCSVHRLVQAVIKERMEETAQRVWAERTVRAVNYAFPDVEFSTWRLCERLLPHAQASLELIERWTFEFPEALRLLDRAGSYLRERAHYSEAERAHKRSLAISEKLWGLDHPYLAPCLSNLAVLYLTEGRYPEAERLMRRSLTITEKTQGTNDLNTGIVLNNLAEIYRALGRYTEAEPLYRRSLAIREITLGPEHSDVATSLNNLALLLGSQENYAEAETLYRRALAIWEKVLGPEHPNVATILNNLAQLHAIQGKNAEAEHLYKRSLAIRENIPGAQHPDVGISLSNLATLYYRQGKFPDAEQLYKRALDILRESWGPEHPGTVAVLESYAALLRKMGRRAEAAKTESRVRTIRAKYHQKNSNE